MNMAEEVEKSRDQQEEKARVVTADDEVLVA